MTLYTVIKKLNEKARGKKRKGSGVVYDARMGQSLVGAYGRGLLNKFVIYHCGTAFEKGSPCVDGVCRQCKQAHSDSGHKCGVCNQDIRDYKEEINQTMMWRTRPKWGGPCPVLCSICKIEM